MARKEEPLSMFFLDLETYMFEELESIPLSASMKGWSKWPQLEGSSLTVSFPVRRVGLVR
jgi:hypothetical protein